tara:strand:- start:9437 stop:9724 length:288 start_codon:yes stop_codon:yes gene_type:complete
MGYFITVVGLLVYSENSFMPYSFFVKWADVQAYESYSNGVDDFKIHFILKDSSKTILQLDKEMDFLKLIEGLNEQMMTEIMFTNKQAKIEVDCGK